MIKCFFRVEGHESKEACGTEELYREVEAGIEGFIHAMMILWAQYVKEEDWVLL